jgi:hypothetical protein
MVWYYAGSDARTPRLPCLEFQGNVGAWEKGGLHRGFQGWEWTDCDLQWGSRSLETAGHVDECRNEMPMKRNAIT